MRVGLLGCGNISKAHLGALASMDGVEVVGVCDRDRFRAAEAAELVASPGVVVASDLEDLLAARPDVVHVLTAPDSHAPLARRVLEAGVHVLVEKPMAMTAADADEMLAVARAHGVQLGTCHNYLFKPSMLAARRIVDDGTIGDVVHVHAFYGMSGEGSSAGSGSPDHWAWRLPGGVFTNVLPHLIAIEQLLLGSITNVSQAFTHGGAAGASELMVLVDGTNASGSMTVSVRARPYVKYVDIFGTKGMVRADLVRELCVVHREQRVPRMVAKAMYSLEEAVQLTAGTVVNMAKVLTGRMGNMPELPATFREFYSSIESGAPGVLSGARGRDMAAVLEQIATQVPIAPPPSRPETGPITAAERRFVDRAGAAKVLVTGANGFLGQRLVDALARCGAEVVAVVRDPSRVSADLQARAEIVTADVREPDRLGAAMGGVDFVFHCAAVTANTVSWQTHYETNVLGLSSVLDLALANRVQRVVHVSSVSVYGTSLSGVDPIDESRPYGTDDESAAYVRSKREADALALRRALEDDVPVTVVRLGILYGPGNLRPIERGLGQVGRFRLTMGNGDNVLPYVYVDNAVDALLLAAVAEGVDGRAYNVVDPVAWSVREAATRTAQVAGDPLVMVPVPAVVLSRAAQFLESRKAARGSDEPPRLSRYVVSSATGDRMFDTTRAERDLGWKPAVSPDDALQSSARG